MYPRNAASPERIAIGPVVQISDGAVQTSGVSVKVLPQGTTASAGSGTIAYEEGVVHYTPTQAETNYTSFILIAYKTGCIPATATVITSASATPGYAGVDWSKVTAATSTVNLSGTTVKTLTDAPADSSGTTTLLSRLSATRAGYLDNLSGGAVALEATAQAILDDTGTSGVVVAAGSKTGYSIGTGGIVAASFAANAIDAVALDATAAAEIRDAVWAKTTTELTGDPGATPTVIDALMLGFMGLRNKRETDSSLGTDKLYNSAGTAILTAAVSDSGTVFTKAKYT